MKKISIATWNINSIRARIPALKSWTEQASPDVILLQETKTEDSSFPFMEVQAMGYPHIETLGQKSYNGVAILSRLPLKNVQKHIPDLKDESEARFLSAEIDGMRVASVYAPNGNPPDSEKFIRKLAFMDALAEHAADMLQKGTAFILAGDFNVIPRDFDAATPERWQGDALTRAESRQSLRTLLHMGLTDAFRALHPTDPGYTFWDYQGGAWQKNDGIRIDFALLSPAMADRLITCEVDKTPRGLDKASDHTPLITTFQTGT